ncbi:MAG TPA: hypothetical protein DDZ51_02585 [Planctomycetaceae bacterium]|nr:hypothetical protein [Planctomycetaceae bacterium]
MIQAVIPPCRQSKKGRQPRTIDMWEVVNTILYRCRSGCQWNMLSHNFPSKSSVCDYFARWRGDGIWKMINDSSQKQFGILKLPAKRSIPVRQALTVKP